MSPAVAARPLEHSQARKDPSDTDVLVVGAFCTGILQRVDRGDWLKRVPLLRWTVTDTVCHIAATLNSYSVLLSSGRKERWRPAVEAPWRDASPQSLIESVDVTAHLLAAAVRQAAPDVLVWHPWGRADRGAIAAMGCDEALAHTWDICRAVHIDFDPPTAPVRAVLDRLFPWAPTSTDPVATLMWANGRSRLGSVARLPQRWRWFSAPLREWDGQGPKVGGPRGALLNWPDAN